MSQMLCIICWILHVKTDLKSKGSRSKIYASNYTKTPPTTTKIRASCRITYSMFNSSFYGNEVERLKQASDNRFKWYHFRFILFQKEIYSVSKNLIVTCFMYWVMKLKQFHRQRGNLIQFTTDSFKCQIVSRICSLVIYRFFTELLNLWLTAKHSFIGLEVFLRFSLFFISSRNAKVNRYHR